MNTERHLQYLHALADTCPYDFAVSPVNGNGFLGAGGDLSVSSLLHAYRSGAFPWFADDEPICWWSPDVRCVIKPNNFRPSKSLKQTAKVKNWHISTNLAFDEVINACSQPRSYSTDTWIGDEIKHAYSQLHTLQVAASIEVWVGVPQKSELIGGLYGVQFGSVFCGESMFHRQSNASKIAFWALMHLAVRSNIGLIDCQLVNPHLLSLGATPLPRANFLQALEKLVHTPCNGVLGVQSFAVQALLMVGDDN